mmetsp:Transcript_6820/g.22630  ORF Transcript_6820/g.22630 Transcript_6820/m.22630 type:complete len:290 (+) Transcript_6820:1412-2281(+)
MQRVPTPTNICLDDNLFVLDILALRSEPRRHAESREEVRAHILDGGERLEHREEDTAERRVRGVAVERHDRDAVAGLEQEGEGVVVHEHCSVHVSPELRQILDVVAVAHAHGCVSVERMRDVPVGIQARDERSRIPLESRREDDQLRKCARLPQKFSHTRSVPHHHLALVHVARLDATTLPLAPGTRRRVRRRRLLLRYQLPALRHDEPTLLAVEAVRLHQRRLARRHGAQQRLVHVQAQDHLSGMLGRRCRQSRPVGAAHDGRGEVAPHRAHHLPLGHAPEPPQEALL